MKESCTVLNYVRREFPEKSWSVSRHGMLHRCARQYFYHYYAAHNGWEHSAPPLAKHAYRLKQLTNLYLVLGDALHEAAAEAVVSTRETGQHPHPETLTKRIRDKLNDVFRRSRRHRDQFMQRPRHNPMLHEMYYDYGPSDDRIETIKDRMALCVPHLLQSKSFLEVTSDAVAAVHGVDKLDAFQFEGSKVYAVPDLFYEMKDGTSVIVDWKTGGEEDDHATQVKVYALYAREKYGVPAENIVVRVEYLMTGTYTESRVTDADLNDVAAFIRESVSRMDELLLDPDENMPRSVEAFPLIADTRLCRYCNFYALCEEEIQQGTGLPSA